MSAEKKPAEAAAEAPKKSRKLLIFGILGVMVLGGGGAGAWLMLKPKPAAPGAKTEKPEESKSDHKAAAQYFKFDPAFVVNFGGTGNSRYLQVTVEAMSRDPVVIEAIKTNEPAIRNDLVLLFSSQQYDTLVSAEGKEKLRQDTLEAIRKTVASEGDKAESVEGVYFTSFVIQ